MLGTAGPGQCSCEVLGQVAGTGDTGTALCDAFWAA